METRVCEMFVREADLDTEQTKQGFLSKLRIICSNGMEIYLEWTGFDPEMEEIATSDILFVTMKGSEIIKVEPVPVL